MRSCLEYASPVWSDLTAELSNLIESIQRIIHPSFSYEDALVCTGLETLSERRHNCCLKFIENTRSEVYHGYNPLANILRQNNNYACEHDYNLRTQRTFNRINTNTERYNNFITCKYFFS